MSKINLHIEIVSSNILELSSMSKKSRDAIKSTLSQHYERVEITLIDNVAELDTLVSRQPDLVFLGMKFLPGDSALSFDDQNKIWLNEYLTARGITCTGSDSFAHKLELNKQLAKAKVLDAGLATSSYQVIKVDQPLIESDLKAAYPLFVKPIDKGGGAGIDSNSIVYDFKQLKHKVGIIAKEFGSSSLVESYLPGREFSVAIMKSEQTVGHFVMPIEIVAPEDSEGKRILSQKVKSADAEQVEGVIEPGIKTAVCELAINVFQALNARDYGRVDIRLDQNGQPQFLEANLIPSLIDEYGSFPKAWVINKKLNYDDMILSITRLGLRRVGTSSSVYNTPYLPFSSEYHLKPTLVT